MIFLEDETIGEKKYVMHLKLLSEKINEKYYKRIKFGQEME